MALLENAGKFTPCKKVESHTLKKAELKIHILDNLRKNTHLKVKEKTHI